MAARTYDDRLLYPLLPAIYRLRDEEQGGPLKALLSVAARETAVVQEGIEQAYDDLFIETCAEWVVPYIAELIGTRLLRLPADSTVSQRAQVANTLALRRRKGTIAVVEEIAFDVTQWPAVAVEFFRLLATTQYAKHARDENVVTADLRDRRGLQSIGTAFDRFAHTFEARRIVNGRGRYNIPNVGICLFRLRAFPLRGVNARRVDDFRYTFDPLGIDQPLFTLPEAERSLADLAQPLNVPVPIDPLALAAEKTEYYPRSFSLRVDGTEVQPGEITVCDLSDAGGAWAHAPEDRYGVDPVLGRLALPSGSPAPPADRVIVSYHYGAPDAIGGGQYDRSPPDSGASPRTLTAGGGLGSALSAAAPAIRFDDSRTYALASASPNLAIPAGTAIVIAARDGERPVLDLSGGPLTVDGGAGSTLTLSGLVINGGLAIGGELAALRLEHCTIVRPGNDALVIASASARVTIDACVLGAVRITSAASASIVRSIVDTGDPNQVAYADTDASKAGGDLKTEKCTIVGRVRTRLLDASNTIFLAEAPAGTPPVDALQVQAGCVRYCYLPLASHTPSRYKCVPATSNPDVRPLVTTLRFGAPGYMQLRPGCPCEIVGGGEDEGEIGVFHDLYQRHREANLRLRLEEFLRFGLEAGIIYAS